MPAKKESRPIQAIKELVIRGSADVFVKRGEPSMTVIADRTEEVTTEIRGGVLTISQKPTMVMGRGVMVNDGCGSIQIGCVQGNVTINSGRGALRVFRGSVGNVAVGDIVFSGDGQPARVEITLPGLSEANIAGAGNLCLEDVNQDAIELEISGSGNATLTGCVKHLDAKISGAGIVHAKQLEAESATLNLSGAGKIKALVKTTLKARVSGAGGIKIWGNPAQRDTRVSGVGEIEFN